MDRSGGLRFSFFCRSSTPALTMTDVEDEVHAADNRLIHRSVYQLFLSPGATAPSALSPPDCRTSSAWDTTDPEPPDPPRVRAPGPLDVSRE
ncbi:hypothetical protein F2P81_018018 [Scophthalmus maximus]|uniref:Uncharacterized protein n=1 Tax=Scophthalmus maximus TaxID=52904 RepID=A0A6A4S3G5_SCOMX|nr:hypothetical protein F2P81_018018 [Scophthalmus maximus]